MHEGEDELVPKRHSMGECSLIGNGEETALTLNDLQMVKVDQAHGFAPLLPEYPVNANANISVQISEGNGFNVFGWGSKGRSRRVPEKLAYGLGRRRIAVPVELIEVFNKIRRCRRRSGLSSTWVI